MRAHADQGDISGLLSGQAFAGASLGLGARHPAMVSVPWRDLSDQITVLERRGMPV